MVMSLAVTAVVSVTAPAVPPKTASSLVVETDGHVVPVPVQFAVTVSQMLSAPERPPVVEPFQL